MKRQVSITGKAAQGDLLAAAIHQLHTGTPSTLVCLVPLDRPGHSWHHVLVEASQTGSAARPSDKAGSCKLVQPSAHKLQAAAWGTVVRRNSTAALTAVQPAGQDEGRAGGQERAAGEVPQAGGRELGPGGGPGGGAVQHPECQRRQTGEHSQAR